MSNRGNSFNWILLTICGVLAMGAVAFGVGIYFLRPDLVEEAKTLVNTVE